MDSGRTEALANLLYFVLENFGRSLFDCNEPVCELIFKFIAAHFCVNMLRLVWLVNLVQ